jgi:anti-sigma regulatory factor (Ser/Thr protein kinase)
MRITSLVDVDSWLVQLKFLNQKNHCLAPTFWRPFHFVTLALQIARSGAPSLGIPEAIAGYASRMHLWQAIGLRPPTDVNERDPKGKFVPLERLDDPEVVHDRAVKLAGICKAYGADKETTNSLEISLQEIMDNCFAHAAVGDALRGLACAQSWPGGKLAQIAIADHGIGVRASLEGNADLRPMLSRANACEVATRFGVTSKPELGHAGYGLALARELFAANGGSLIVRSGSEWSITTGEKSAEGVSLYTWPGTLIVLEWNCDKPLRVKDVYSGWPAVTGYSDDDFDFPF